MSFRGITYAPDQIDSYLSRIGFPDTPRPTPEHVTSDYGLEYLRRLQKYQMQACPFENLNMHYTKDMVKSLFGSWRFVPEVRTTTMGRNLHGEQHLLRDHATGHGIPSQASRRKSKSGYTRRRGEI